MSELERIKALLEQGDVTALTRYLVERYPRGLVGERDELVTLFMKAGLGHAEAVRWASRLEDEGYAHHLPGASPRWIFTSKPVSFAELARIVKGEWDDFTGKENEALEEAYEFIQHHLGVDREVAEEVYRGLEAAGYASVVFQEAPEFNRERVLFEFPEVFLKQV
ncbi:hypothetical protein [Oceanithermus sp.]